MVATTVARLATVEARWFGEGPPDDALLAWFGAEGEVRRYPPRTDVYIRLPGVTGVGVKRRHDRFEIKARRDGPTARVVWAGSATPLERWLKWSAPHRPIAGDPLPPVEVVKTRRLGSRGGVQVELAALAVAGARFWTFGLEGGSAGEVETVLAGAWAAGAPRADVAFTGAYPAWIDHIAAD